MASAKFLEEALSTDVDESAVSAIVGSLETQLGSAAPPPTSAAPPQVTQNHHVNATVSNGATNVVVGGPPPPVAVSQPQQKHPNMANGDSVSLASVDQVNQQQQQQQQQVKSVPEQPVKIVQLNQAMSGATGAILQNRVTLPNGTISLPQQKVVLKTSGGPGAPAGLVTVPVQQANNVDAAQAATSQAQNIISGLQVVNVRPGMQPQKGQPARVVLSAPQLVGARPGTPQLTLQSFHGLQPGQQGALLLKTENGQYQLLRVGPPPTAVSQATGQPVAYRMQTVPATAVSATTTPIQTSTISSTTPAVHQDQAGQQTPQQTTPQVQQVHVQQQQPRPANDNTKEKCRKFLANLLELSSREPKAVEKNVRTLIQELIDNKVEPEDFCDKLERLLNASPQPCLIGFLKKSLPLLRHSLATQEMTIDGIRPPAADVVFSVAGAAPTVQTAVRPGLANQVRIVGQAATTTVNRPGQQVIQQRLVAPVRTQTPGVATATVPVSQMQVVRPQQQQQPPQQQQQQQVHPPALHPVYANSGQPVRAVASGVVRQPVQVRQVAPGVMAAGQVPRHQLQIRQVAPAISPASHKAAAPVSRPPPPPKGAGQVASKQQLKDKEKKTFQSAAAAAAAAASASAAYGGDDDINDVAAMGGVNLAEETQKILGSTEFVGTQIRSCKEEPICLMQPLQQKIRSAVQKYGLDEPTTIDVAACVSHAAQERLKNLLEKLAVITEHRLENVRTDNRYEVTNDVKGQLKFLEDLDKAERKRHEETERELLLRAAKSRSKSEDPEQAKLKAKAKEMQRVEMEELRQREANATALQAIGPRKKPKLDGDPMTGGPQASTGGPNSTLRAQMPLRQRMKKATLRDLQFLFETEKDLCKSKLLYRSYLK